MMLLKVLLLLNFFSSDTTNGISDSGTSEISTDTSSSSIANTENTENITEVSTATPNTTEDENENQIKSNSTRSSSGGLSTGGIIGIAIPCIAALVGVGAVAALLGGATPQPPPSYIDTSSAQLAIPKEIPVQPQVIQPQVEIPPPQPVQQVVPIQKVEPPVIQKIVPQPVVQPQMVPVQQMQLVPVQQVEMVPVQHVEMVPVQEVIPTYQAAAQVAPQITQVSGIQQGIQGGEFISAPEGYGTSVIQTNNLS